MWFIFRLVSAFAASVKFRIWQTLGVIDLGINLLAFWAQSRDENQKTKAATESCEILHYMLWIQATF
uniref:Uncharacterized protein n=1 Tax=Cucumis sativus TaxID=3659 RepID=A0A0A0KRV2_CUCSA